MSSKTEELRDELFEEVLSELEVLEEKLISLHPTIQIER